MDTNGVFSGRSAERQPDAAPAIRSAPGEGPEPADITGFDRPGGTRPVKLSVIICVHNTEEFIQTCLDSISAQSFGDFELIAVDDASTDGTLALLEQHAAREPRMTIVSLDRNVGVGGARNAGMERAGGDYVWFVDGDDWIDRNALEKIVAKLEADQPDVLLFGWLRVYPNGRDSGSLALTQLKQAPKSFALHDWPQAIDILHTPWNKVVRRDLLVGTGFKFATGWYQDITFTYLMLAAAPRIGTLPEILIYYRQHAAGAMRTKSRGHLAVLDQWSSAFDLVNAHSPHPEVLQSHLFEHMVWHLHRIIRNPGRLPANAWTDFADGARNLWHAHVPAGYRIPRGIEGLPHRLFSGRLGLIRLIPLAALIKAKIARTVGFPSRNLLARHRARVGPAAAPLGPARET